MCVDKIGSRPAHVRVLSLEDTHLLLIAIQSIQWNSAVSLLFNLWIQQISSMVKKKIYIYIDLSERQKKGKNLFQLANANIVDFWETFFIEQHLDSKDPEETFIMTLCSFVPIGP